MSQLIATYLPSKLSTYNYLQIFLAHLDIHIYILIYKFINIHTYN